MKITERSIGREQSEDDPVQMRPRSRAANSGDTQETDSWRVGENYSQQPRGRSMSPPRQDPSPTDTPNPNQYVDGESWGELSIRDRVEPNDRIESRVSVPMHVAEDGERENGSTRSREMNAERLARDSGNLDEGRRSEADEAVFRVLGASFVPIIGCGLSLLPDFEALLNYK
ncbi:hypothetical protein EG327_010470 [Venturia inaequalis]|uniref:Uncharacterized protein n=1 Tax=Venturia inaequalis TaxID=5025 RepID=A0A8H3VMM0_VENIN|nr:hypothetical protein EG327_010470 [Venturia inaequalis]